MRHSLLHTLGNAGFSSDPHFPGNIVVFKTRHIPEETSSTIFGRLTAWQNWIFQRPNAVGEKGALTAYGSQSRPEFDFSRT